LWLHIHPICSYYCRAGLACTLKGQFFNITGSVFSYGYPSLYSFATLYFWLISSEMCILSFVLNTIIFKKIVGPIFFRIYTYKWKFILLSLSQFIHLTQNLLSYSYSFTTLYFWLISSEMCILFLFLNTVNIKKILYLFFLNISTNLYFVHSLNSYI